MELPIKAFRKILNKVFVQKNENFVEDAYTKQWKRQEKATYSAAFFRPGNRDIDVVSNEARETFLRESTFVSVVNDVLFELANTLEVHEISSINNRALATELLFLLKIHTEGKLDQMYDKYLTEQGLDKATVTIVQERKIKLALIKKTLELIVKTQKKEKMLSLNPEAVTVGLEIEFVDLIVQELLRMHDFIGTFENECGNSLIGVEIDTVNSTKVKKKFREKFNRYVQLSSLFGDKTLKRLEIMLQISDIKRNIPFFGSAHKISSPNVRALGVSIDGSYDTEIVTNPSFSLKTQLKELLWSTSVWGIDSEWNIHETFSQVQLTPDHVEFMDGLLIVAAAGFLSSSVFEAMIDDSSESEMNELIISERYSKSSHINQKYYFFPFHRSREAGNLLFVSGKKFSSAVELRSILKYKPGEFSLFVRQFTFSYLFSYAVVAVQKDPTDRTDWQITLVHIYETLLSQWNEILREFDIPSVTQSGYWLEQSVSDVDLPLEYERLLSELIVTCAMSEKGERLKQKTRAIIREFSVAAKAVIPGMK